MMRATHLERQGGRASTTHDIMHRCKVDALDACASTCAQVTDDGRSRPGVRLRCAIELAMVDLVAGIDGTELASG